MSVIELEAQKAGLAREILSLDNETKVNTMWLFLKGCHPATEFLKGALSSLESFLNHFSLFPDFHSFNKRIREEVCVLFPATKGALQK